MGKISGNGQSVSITDAGTQLQLDCICKGKEFHIFVVPLGIRPGAAITKVQCHKCKNVFVISENGIVGDKAYLWKDHQNRKHHTMKAEPGIYKIHK